MSENILTIESCHDQEHIENIIDRYERGELIEVVRCKGCRHNVGGNKCLHPNSIMDIPKDDDFCSYGERRAK